MNNPNSDTTIKSIENPNRGDTITMFFKHTIILIAVLLVLPMKTSHAAVAWYYGTVQRVFLYSDGFVVTFNSAALDDCFAKYVYVKVSQLGDKKVDRAYSMALAAQASGRTLGFVIDKAINGPGGQCQSTGSMDIKD